MLYNVRDWGCMHNVYLEGERSCLLNAVNTWRKKYHLIIENPYNQK